MIDTMHMTRGAATAVLAGSLARAAGKLPAHKNVKWALRTNLFNSFKGTTFTDILDVMRDTGFIGARLTQFPQILQTCNISAAQMQQECSKRGVQIFTISFSGPARIVARRAEMLDNAKKAMTFLKGFGAEPAGRGSGYRAQRPARRYERCDAYVTSKLEPIYT